MQNLIEKMERAIAIDKQDAASSDVAEIKTVARYRGPMIEQFANELKDVSAAVDDALDAKSKLVAASEREAAELRVAPATSYESKIIIEEMGNITNRYGHVIGGKVTAHGEHVSTYANSIAIDGWRLISLDIKGGVVVLALERRIKTDR